MTTCLQCSNELTGRQEFYCSRRCGKNAQDRRRHYFGRNEAWRRADRPCAKCGSMIPDVFPDRKNCDACIRNYAREQYQPRGAFQFKTCLTCKNALPKFKKKYCSHLCFSSDRVTQSAPQRQDCATCGEPFLGRKRKYCSANCRERRKRAYRNNRQRQRYDPQRQRDHYFRADVLTKRRRRRALIASLKQVYQDLLGERVANVRLTAAAPIVEIGDWSSYVVLPSFINRGQIKNRQGVRRTPLLITHNGFVSYVVHRGGRWSPYVNKKPPRGSYGSDKSKLCLSRYRLKRRHRDPMRNHGPHGRWSDQDSERRRIRQRNDSAILAAFRELNLLSMTESQHDDDR